MVELVAPVAEAFLLAADVRVEAGDRLGARVGQLRAQRHLWLPLRGSERRPRARLDADADTGRRRVGLCSLSGERGGARGGRRALVPLPPLVHLRATRRTLVGPVLLVLVADAPLAAARRAVLTEAERHRHPLGALLLANQRRVIAASRRRRRRAPLTQLLLAASATFILVQSCVITLITHAWLSASERTHERERSSSCSPHDVMNRM